MIRYLHDPQQEPAAAYCKVCYGEIYSGDQCYSHEGGYICAICAEGLGLLEDETPMTGEEVTREQYPAFFQKGNDHLD